MPIQNAIYGELLTSKEVCEVTGFTMNQLRNWRSPNRRDLAPFGFVSIGVSPYYRKVVVQDYLDEQGPQQGVYVMSERDKKFPVAIGESISIERNNAIAVLSKVTTENVYAWLESQLDKQGIRFTDTWKSLWNAWDELDVELPYITYHQRWENTAWFRRAVLVARTYLAQQQELEIDAIEIGKLDVGNVPPLNEKK
jgi:hypothetical protein